jgi:hypothetical protein
MIYAFIISNIWKLVDYINVLLKPQDKNVKMGNDKQKPILVVKGFTSEFGWDYDETN